jgi:uncharacterized protein YciI
VLDDPDRAEHGDGPDVDGGTFARADVDLEAAEDAPAAELDVGAAGDDDVDRAEDRGGPHGDVTLEPAEVGVAPAEDGEGAEAVAPAPPPGPVAGGEHAGQPPVLGRRRKVVGDAGEVVMGGGRPDDDRALGDVIETQAALAAMALELVHDGPPLGVRRSHVHVGIVPPRRSDGIREPVLLRAVRVMMGAMHWVLLYDLVDDYLELRAPLRDEHLALARAAHERGELLMAGALAGPVDGAVLVWRADDPSVVEAFAAADPYVREGLVTAWRVRPWTVVVGGEG